MRQGWTLTNDGGAANNGMDPLTKLGTQLVGARIVESARAAMAIHMAQHANEIACTHSQSIDCPWPAVGLLRKGGSP